MNSETTEKLLDVLSNLMAGYRDLTIRVNAAENMIQRDSLGQFREYEKEREFVKSQIDMTPQMIALEKLRKLLNQS